MCVPILTPSQVAQHVVDRRFGFASPEATALGDLLVSMDTQSVRAAEEADAHLTYLESRCEDPLEQFERLAGRSLRTPGA